jgi:putative hemolysin
MVLDEYGQIAGLVTLEDMLEEVVGEIADEYDEIEDAVVQREDGSYLVDGLLAFRDLQERLNLPPLDDSTRPRDFATAAGFVLALLGHIPAVGESVTWHGYVFEVVDMDGRRIDKLLVRPPKIDAATQTEGVLASSALLPPPAASADEDTLDQA